MCTASHTSSPWHNFVSDTDHWVDGSGATPCVNTGGIFPLASGNAFMASMVSNGAKNIFTSTTDAVFKGSPSPGNQIYIDLSSCDMFHITTFTPFTKDWPLKKLTTFAFGQFTTISGHFLPTT